MLKGRKYLCELINGLLRNGLPKISLVTNATLIQAPDLRALCHAGLKRITISLHTLDPKKYMLITGKPYLPHVLKVIDQCLNSALSVVKINRVLLPGCTEDLRQFVQWIRNEALTARFYRLFWPPRGLDSETNPGIIAWEDYLNLWADETEWIEVNRYSIPSRDRLSFHLHGGGTIEADVFRSKRGTCLKICQDCEYAQECQEGFFGCGVRIGPDLRIRSCLLKPGLAVSISDLVSRDYQGKDDNILSAREALRQSSSDCVTSAGHTNEEELLSCG